MSSSDAADVPNGTAEHSHSSINWVRKAFEIFIAGLLLAVITWAVIHNTVKEKSVAKLTPAVSTSKATQATAPVVTLASQMQRIESQHIAIAISNAVVVPSPQDISGWLTNDGSNIDSIKVNPTAVKSYLDQLTTKYTVQPTSRIIVTNYDGSTNVMANGTTAVSIGSDQPAEDSIIQNLLAAKGVQLNIPSTSSPLVTVKTYPYTKLLEVNLTTKRMYAYDLGTLEQTFLITGGAPATPTPVGQFKIWDKLLIQNMTGYNTDGTKYYQPNVQWVNYFDHSGDAIHGNYWRPLSVFGSVNTSHGCVGVVNSDAQWIYNWAPVGTTVITHL
jgi:lipoprotein-anchoring transpeptidase ErfK/SrfK